MKKVLPVTFILYVFFLLIGCSFQESQNGNAEYQAGSCAYIQICTPFASGAEDSRTAVPYAPGTSFPVQSYVITASKSGISDVSITISKDEFASKYTMNLHSEGTWSLIVNGYASVKGTGDAICTGNGSIKISSAPYYDGLASVTVYPTGSGTGTLSLSASIPVSVNAASVTLTGPMTSSSDGTSYTAAYTTATDGGMDAGTSAHTFTISTLTASGTSDASSSFAAGEYLLTLQLYTSSDISSGTPVYRRSEEVAVWNGFTTSTWIDAYTFASGTTGTASYSSLLSVAADDLSSTDTSCTMTAKAASKVSSSVLSSGSSRYMTEEDDTTALAVTVASGKRVVVKAGGNGTDVPETAASSVIKDSSGNYVLSYTLPSPSSAADSKAYVTVYAKNGIASQVNTIIYGPEYVSQSSGSDSNDGSKLLPYATIPYAVGSLADKTDASNTVVMLGGITYASSSDCITINDASLVLAIKGCNSSGSTLQMCDLNADSKGRVLAVTAAGTLTLEYVNMTGGSLSSGNGAGLYVASGTVNLVNAKLSSDAAASGAGGGIYADGGTINIKSGTTITSNTAANGGGIYVSGGAVCMTGGTLSGNTSTVSGGAVFMNGGTFSMGGTTAVITQTDSAGNNDVYLASGRTITVTGALASSCASVTTAVLPAADTPVVIAGGYSSYNSDQPYLHFSSTAQYGVGKNSSGDAQIAYSSGTMSVDLHNLTVTIDPVTVTHGSSTVITATAKDSSGNDITTGCTWSLVLYNHAAVAASSSSNTITFDSSWPADAYQLYASVTYNGTTSNTTVNITAN